MGNSVERIIEETSQIQSWIEDNDQESLRAYIMRNKLRLSEHLDDAESILQLAVRRWQTFEELVTWYQEYEPNFRVDRYHDLSGRSMFVLALNSRAEKKFLELFLKLYGKDRFYELVIAERLSILDYLKKFPTRQGHYRHGNEHIHHDIMGQVQFSLVDFILRNIPYNQHKVIELIGEDNVDSELLDYYNSDVWFNQEKTGLIYINHFRWGKAISKNLMLEIFEILKPKPLTTQTQKPRRRSGHSIEYLRNASFDSYNDYREYESIDLGNRAGGIDTTCYECGETYDVSCNHECMGGNELILQRIDSREFY